MGKLEQELKKEIRRTKINTVIIKTIAAAVLLPVVAITAPALGIVGRYSKQRTYSLKSSLSRLISAGYLTFEVEGNKKYLRLTHKGEHFAALLGEGKLAIKKPKRWDKKWRILIFDIPERRKNTRNKIRSTLISLGFIRLQDSVWVHPYECEDLVMLLKTDFRLGKNLLYIIADKIEHDEPLRKQFGLV